MFVCAASASLHLRHRLTLKLSKFAIRGRSTQRFRRQQVEYTCFKWSNTVLSSRIPSLRSWSGSRREIKLPNAASAREGTQMLTIRRFILLRLVCQISYPVVFNHGAVLARQDTNEPVGLPEMTRIHMRHEYNIQICSVLLL